MKLKGKYSESAPLYAILLSVGLVAAVAVFFIVLNLTGAPAASSPAPAETTAAKTTTAPPETKETVYDPGADISDEMKDAAQKLLLDNYSVLSLYYIYGLDHKDEPYGNEPEDGYYTVKDEKYTSLEQIEEIVDRTYTKDFADKIKTDPLGTGPVYKTRDSGDLGINMKFAPMDYSLSWNNPKFQIIPQSHTECTIELVLHEKSDDSEKRVTAQMIKQGDDWRLTSIVF